ncbi:MAG: hypothetical protein EA383_17360 [Spirochaetaceae bacterium]|nr:MAG: hypothetical protein EA383_17360 [Spirochaetaceae bacterium]
METQHEQAGLPPRDDEIDLIDLIAVIWRYKILIVLLTLLAAAAAGAYTWLGDTRAAEPADQEPAYTAHALLLFEPVAREIVVNAQITTVARSYSTLGVRLLEGMVRSAEAGAVELPFGADVRDAVASAQIEQDGDDESLVALSAVSSEAATSEAALSAMIDALTERFTASGLSAQVSGGVPLFYVIEPIRVFSDREAAEVIDATERRPAVMITVAAFAGLFFSIFLAFVLNYARQVKNDPEAMRKLKGV